MENNRLTAAIELSFFSDTTNCNDQLLPFKRLWFCEDCLGCFSRLFDERVLK